MKVNNKYIGTNYANGLIYGGIQSSYNQSFTNEEVLIESGISDIIPCVIGDIKDAYDLLQEIIKQQEPKSLEHLCECIFETIQTYFGNHSNINQRLSFYNSIDFIETEDDIGKVSNLKGQNAAMCVERAMLAQNLLQSLGISSYYKCSGITKNNQPDSHAYNIISANNHYYIFDATMPKQENRKITPIVAEIPEEVYLKITNPTPRIGYSVETKRFNPLTNEEIQVTYDSNREYTYSATNQTRISK